MLATVSSSNALGRKMAVLDVNPETSSVNIHRQSELDLHRKGITTI